MKKLQLGTSHFKMCRKVTVSKCISVNSHVCWRTQPVSRGLWALNIIKNERFFYLQSWLKHNTSMCALQLSSVNVYDLFFFSFKVLSYHAAAPLEEANKLKVFS